MASSFSLKIGGRDVQLTRSETQVAVRPNLGTARSMESEVRAAAEGAPVERRGRLEGFEIVEIQAPAEAFGHVRSRLREAASVKQEVPVYHTSADRVPFVPVGTIYLSFKGEASNDARQGILERYALELVSAERNGFLTVRVTGAGTDPVELATKLQREAVVALAEPDLVTTRRLDSFVLPDDPLLALQWHLENAGTHGGQSLGYKQGADARVVAAWRRLGGLGSRDVVVGVIDDGFDLSHPDIAGKAVHAWDFGRNSSDVRPEPDLTAPNKGNWHGTACAGVAIGMAEGGQVVGAAPNARLLPVRMGESLSPMQMCRWFDHMTDHGAWVVSCSWNADAAVYPLPERVAQAITRCAREGRDGNGCLLVFAAGNDGKNVNDPPRSLNGLAIHPDVLAVAASTSLDKHADYSSIGKEIAVCAPSGGVGGWNVITCDATGTYVDAAGIQRSCGYAAGDYHPFFTGTSSACPLVAGVCALVLSANPDLTATDVREIVKSTARKIGSSHDYSDGHSIKFGHGCVDAESAVREALSLRAGRLEVAAERAREYA